MSAEPSASRQSRRQAKLSPDYAHLRAVREEENEFDSDAEPFGETHSNPAFAASEEVPEASLSEVLVLLHRLSHRIDSIETNQQHSAPPDPRAQPAEPTGTDPVDEHPLAPARASRRRSAPENSFVNHPDVRHRIAAGYEAQAPSALASLQPHVYFFNDEISRTLAGTRFSAKLSEYRLTCVNGFFLSCANQALLEVMEAIDTVSPDVRSSLSEIYNTYMAIENIMRDRKTFLATQNDPNATQVMRAFSDTILRNRFEADFAAYGASADSVRSYDSFTDQVARSRLWATAKAEAQRELEAGNPRANSNPDKPPNPRPDAGRGKDKDKGKYREKGKQGADTEKADKADK